MRQAGLAPVDPSVLHRRAIADQEPGSVRHQGLERGVAPARLHREQRHRGVDHHPQPHPQPVPRPAGLGHVMDGCPPGLHRHGLVIGVAGLGAPSPRALNRAVADRYSQDRPATLLHGAATGPLTTRPRAQQGRAPGTIAGGSGRGNRGFRDPATPGTARLPQHNMLPVHLDVGQLDDLMGRGGARAGKRRLPTATRRGLALDDVGRLPQCLAMPRMPGPGPWGTLGRVGGVRVHPGRIGGGRTIGLARVPRHPCVEGREPRLTAVHPFVWWPSHCQHMDNQCLNDHRRLVPCGGIQRQSFGRCAGGNHGRTPRDGQPCPRG